MIQDEYIKFETARLLKEKGFDEKCGYCYAFFDEDDIRVLELKHHISGLSLAEKRYPYVTQSVALKWLREVHNLYINIFVTWKNKIPHYQWSIDNLLTQDTIYETPCLEKYEGACEAAIKYCLINLI